MYVTDIIPRWSHSHTVVHRDRLLCDSFVDRESPRKLLSSRNTKESATHEVYVRTCMLKACMRTCACLHVFYVTVIWLQHMSSICTYVHIRMLER